MTIFLFIAGHGRIHEHTETVGRTACVSRTPGRIFQTESLHGRYHKQSSPTVTAAVEQEIQHFRPWEFIITVEFLLRRNKMNERICDFINYKFRVLKIVF